MYLDVIEHIKEDKKEIFKAFKLLKKGGKLIINVPAFSHLYSKFDKDVGHFRRYSKTDFKKILSKISYSEANFIYYDSIGYLLSFMSRYLYQIIKKILKKN